MAPIDSEEIKQSDVMFENYNEDQKPTIIESLCVNCENNGETTLLLTKIPFYKEVILMSFKCKHCGFSNNELQSGGKIQDKGTKFKVKINTIEDLNLQVIKSDYASIDVPVIGLEIPHDSQKGVVTTVEGTLQRVISGLEQDQTVRRITSPEDAEKIDDYIEKIKKLLIVKEPFYFILSDPSGNSFIQNRCAPEVDPDREVTTFIRTKEQNHLLGLYEENQSEPEPPLASTEGSTPTESTATSTSVLSKDPQTATESSQQLVRERARQLIGEKDNTELDLTSEVHVFLTNCPDCNAPCKTNMKITQIPHFKEVVIMATLCDSCGHKTNEVKAGGGIEPKGKKIIFQCKAIEDLSRDLLKSETCSIEIPELKFHMGGFALGGRFTTLEGLLNNIHDQVTVNPLMGSLGDSSTEEKKKKMAEFKAKLEKMMKGEISFTIVLDDPAGNSYLQDLCSPEIDPQLKTEHYERTYEQNDELGINDMKVENYGGEEHKNND